MTAADVAGAAAVSAEAFEITFEDAEAVASWEYRVGYALRTDPGGAFVTEAAGRITGVAQAIVRERLWCLSLLTVAPAAHGAGAGRALMDAALGYRRAADCGLIVSSNHPNALRLYGASGFSLLPTLQTEGPLDRRRMPPADPGVREGGIADLDACAGISRALRGAAHTAELAFSLERGARLLLLGDRGFAVVQPNRGVWMLAALDEETARALLWSALDLVEPDVETYVRWITGHQQWAIELLIAAGFRLSAYGALCVQGEPGPLWPYIPSPPFA